MKIVVTGACGQLGQSLRPLLEEADGVDPVFTDVADLDITSASDVEMFINSVRPDVIVNCAAFTAVDKAESENLAAAAINTDGVCNLARSAANAGSRIIQISTDYVFSGESYRPYVENDEPYPQSIYGRTKLAGEGILSAFCKDSVIIRTAWLYSEYGNNFVKTMLRLAREGKALKVVCDQIGTPTYAGDLASAIVAIILAPEWKPGIYHYTDEGVASWYDFAMQIFRIMRLSPDIKPVTSKDYPSQARRPMYSVLSKEKIKRTYGLEIPYWVDSLSRCLQNFDLTPLTSS